MGVAVGNAEEHGVGHGGGVYSCCAGCVFDRALLLPTTRARVYVRTMSLSHTEYY